MNHPTDDENLLTLFRDWLARTRAEAESLEFDPTSVHDPTHEAPPEVGLYRLVEEFTALRHEVKLETKGSRGLQEQVETLLPTIRQAVDHLRSVAPREEQAAQAVGRPLAEAIADLDEALDRGRREVDKARSRFDNSIRAAGSNFEALYQSQPWYCRLGLRAYHSQVRDFFQQATSTTNAGLLDALLEGYDLIGARLRRAMETGQITRIDCVGLPVDPDRMTVVEVVDAPEVEPGHVVDQVRRGYTWRGRIIRYAEVRAAQGRSVTAEEHLD